MLVFALRVYLFSQSAICFFFSLQSWLTAIYLLYAKLEEEYGLARHAMAVYERATQAVETEERHQMFNIYIKRAAEIYGVTHTRAIYQKAIEVTTHSRVVKCQNVLEMFHFHIT